MPAAGQDFYGKTAGEMITDAWVGEDGTVTGTFHYVTGYTGFTEAVPAEQDNPVVGTFLLSDHKNE